MRALYTEADEKAVHAQLNRRKLVLGLVALPLAVVFVISLIRDDGKANRPEWISIVYAILIGAVLIFGWDLFCRPISCYFRHIRSALHDRFREADVVFDSFGENDSVINGVAFRDLHFLGEADKHGDRSRLFYWDKELPLPSLQKGQEVTVRYYDRFITALSDEPASSGRP